MAKSVEETGGPALEIRRRILEKVMSVKKRTVAGRWTVTRTSAPQTSPAIVPVELDMDKITRTISSIREWLTAGPVKKDVEAVIEYEKANVNRSGAVGDEGCLTLYLEGE